jgi:hypothetical protein
MLSVLITLIIIGVLLRVVETSLPLSPPIKTLIRVVVVLIVIVWLLRVLGVALPSL